MSDHCSIEQQAMHLPMATDALGSMDCEVVLGSIATRRRRSRRGRNNTICPSRFVLLALCFVASTCWQHGSHAFTQSPLSTRRSSFSCPAKTNYFQTSKSYNRDRRLFSSLAEPPASRSNSSSSGLTDFQKRMKGLVRRNGGRRGAGQRATDKPANLKTVESLEDYKKALDANCDKMVVVRFFATWCKACKAIQPSYYRMASLYPHITFLEVPVTNSNANLHQGLEVPSLPYGHIYFPEAGLVEELKISKKYFINLVKMVRWYDAGECGLDDYVPPVVNDEEK